jgi:hypothetical protein
MEISRGFMHNSFVLCADRLLVLTAEEQAEINSHEGHQTLDITSVSDSRRQIYCTECGVFYPAGMLSLI